MTDPFLPDELEEVPALKDSATISKVLREIKSLQDDLADVEAAFKEEIERLKDLQISRTAERVLRLEQLKEAVRFHMIDNELDKIESPIALVNLKPGGHSLIIEDEDKAGALLTKYLPDSISYKINKNLVKKHIEDLPPDLDAFIQIEQGEPFISLKFN